MLDAVTAKLLGLCTWGHLILTYTNFSSGPLHSHKCKAKGFIILSYDSDIFIYAVLYNIQKYILMFPANNLITCNKLCPQPSAILAILHSVHCPPHIFVYFV